MRLALVHDCIVHIGGAERVLQSLHAIFPDAPIYTLVCDKTVAEELLPGAKVIPSFVQDFPWAKRHFRAYAPLFPTAVESFDLTDFDVILSSSWSFAKGVITPPRTPHICYCHSPFRYLWSEYHFHRRALFASSWKRIVVDPFLTGLRLWDRIAADRVDEFVANSQCVADRIAKYYRRRSVIVYPPVPVTKIRLGDLSGSYYLLVSRLMAYKRVDVAIEAFNRLGLPLKIVGTGPLHGQLRHSSKPNIEFLGNLSDAALEDCFAGCRALVFPGYEDFGIVMVEAQSYGKPVIAYGAGGASEIVVDGRTGVLLKEQSRDAIIEAVKKLDRINFAPEEIRQNALRFDTGNFQRAMKQIIESAYARGGSSTKRGDAQDL